MRLEYDHFTDKGGRPINEDFADMVSKPDACCFVLCDGLGGHGMGDKASQFVVRFVKDYFLSCSSTEAFIADVIERTQSALHAKQEELALDGKMKTTGVILVLEQGKATCLHVGDSRLYQFRGDSIVFRTRDHSIPQMLVLTGEITENDIRRHPDRNKVLRAFGDDHDPLKFDKTQLSVAVGDTFLLCTDGFWEPVTEEERVDKMRKTKSVKKWLAEMAAAARNNSNEKSMDNFTAVAVRIKG